MALKIEVHPTAERVAAAAANRILQLAREAVQQKGFFSLALAGGRTPNLLYELLTKEPTVGTMPWDQTLFFWGDERYVPPTHADSNYGAAMTHLLSKVPIPARNVYPMLTAAPDPQTAAQVYEQTIRQVFRDRNAEGFDLILLGMGTDGHTASLFPGSPAVHIADKWVAASQAPGGQDRLTITFSLINASISVLFLVTGLDKREMLATIVAEREQGIRRYPAAMAAGRAETVWMVDQQAVQLSKDITGRR